MNKPHYLGHRKRLKEKYDRQGINSLADYEIIELLLSYTIPRKDTKEPAKNLLKKCGNIKEIFYNLEKENFTNVKGIGEKSFIFFKFINDIFKLISKEALCAKDKIKSPNDVVSYCRKLMWNLKNEEFKVIFLNSKNEILNISTTEQGIINEAYVYFRKIFEEAFKYRTTAMILIHNHPSGNDEPSQDDIETTKKIIKTAESLNITVHDHIIVTENNYFSFKENNLI